VSDGGTDLALDVVSHDRQAGVLELLRPLRRTGDEDGQCVDEAAACVNGALGVELGGILRADGQVAHDDVDLCFLKRGNDIDGGRIGFSDGLAVVLAETVEGHAALHGDAGPGYIADLDGVVLGSVDGVGEIETDFLHIDIECGDELHVADVVFAELHVHETGDCC
jgi:hypothetical protein